MRFMSLAGSAGVAALAMLATPAFAQDTGTPDEFSGFYVGGTIGYDTQPNDVGESILFDRNLDGTFNDTVTTAAGANAFSPGFCNGSARATTPAFGCTNDKDAISYSARLGYDRQVGNFLGGGIVFGAVIEGGKSEIRDSVSAFSTTPARYTMTREIDFNASARLRLGYAANRTLFYGTGGLAYARVDHSFSTSNTANAFTGRGKRDAWGYVAGGGVEQKLGRHFSIGLEYLFNKVKDDNYLVRASAGTAPATNPFILAPNTTGTDFKRSYNFMVWHSMRVTAAFRF